MTKAQYRSGSWKKFKKRNTKGVIIKFKRKRAKGSKCECGRLLSGVKKKGAKSQKKVSRRDGGKVCSKCLKKVIIMKSIGAG